MTKEELARDCEKFCEYLQVNGVRVTTFALMNDKIDTVYMGNPECMSEMFVQIYANQLGLKVVPK